MLTFLSNNNPLRPHSKVSTTTFSRVAHFTHAQDYSKGHDRWKKIKKTLSSVLIHHPRQHSATCCFDQHALANARFGGMSSASSQEAVSLIDTNHDWKAASIGRVHQSGARAVHPVTHTCTHSCGAVSCRHGMARPL